MRYLPKQDEYGRWAVLDTLWDDPWMMVPRFADEVSALGFADILNATGCGWREKERLWAAHREVRVFAPLLTRDKT